MKNITNQMQIDELLSKYDDKVIALTISISDLKTPENPTQEEFELVEEKLEEAQKLFDDGDYSVLTDEEADDKREENLDNYIDECIIPELPKYLQNYFNYEARKRDARFDGRGHSLSTYDGVETEQEYNGETYYIYRQN